MISKLNREIPFLEIENARISVILCDNDIIILLDYYIDYFNQYIVLGIDYSKNGKMICPLLILY